MGSSLFFKQNIIKQGGQINDRENSDLTVNNLDLKKVTYVAGGRAFTQAMVAGRADACLGNGFNSMVNLMNMGVKSPQLLKFRDWGLADCGDGIIANLETVKKNPDMVRRFVRASVRGINHMFMDLEAAADMAVKHFPMTKRAQLVKQLQWIKWLFVPPTGWQDPKAIKALRDITAKFADVPQAKDMPISKFFTNEFLPKY